MYKFQTVVKVPGEVIEKIGNDIAEQFFGQLNVQMPHLEDGDVKLIMSAYADAVSDLAMSNKKTIDGWTLSSHAITEIASHLKQGHKIAAIKCFRQETDACLIDSKNFIERYDNSPAGAKKIIEDFMS
jgi:ribosomal protein L7/L12